MNSYDRDKIEKYRNKNLIGSIKCGIEGVKFGFKYENNFKFYVINLMLFLIVNILILKLNSTEIIIYLLTGITTISFEFINTAIEEICNNTTTEYNEGIKHIKDLGSAADMTIGLFYYGIEVYWIIRFIVERIG